MIELHGRVFREDTCISADYSACAPREIGHNLELLLGCCHLVIDLDGVEVQLCGTISD
jgi:hypothetical protein